MRDSGLGEGRLRGADLARPFHGVRSDHELGLAELCRACSLVMPPRHVFSHVTAARLWGCPLPVEFASGEPLHVTVPQSTAAPRRQGVVGHRANAVRAGWRSGLPVTDAASTWLSLATLLPLDELVACGDHLVLDPAVLDPADLRPYVTIDELGLRLQEFRGRGARTATSAFRLMREGAESRPETLLRLLLARAGLPEPTPGSAVTAPDGRWLGRGDLVYPTWRTVVEYDGDGHRTSKRQYDRDITRIEDFVLGDWSVVRVRSRGLFISPDATVERVRRVLESRGWCPAETRHPVARVQKST